MSYLLGLLSIPISHTLTTLKPHELEPALVFYGLCSFFNACKLPIAKSALDRAMHK